MYLKFTFSGKLTDLAAAEAIEQWKTAFHSKSGDKLNSVNQILRKGGRTSCPTVCSSSSMRKMFQLELQLLFFLLGVRLLIPRVNFEPSVSHGAHPHRGFFIAYQPQDFALTPALSLRPPTGALRRERGKEPEP